MKKYERPNLTIVEVVIEAIATSGPPAVIPNPDVEVVDFGYKASVWDEVDNNNLKEESYEVYE